MNFSLNDSKAPERAPDGLGQLAGRRTARVRPHDLPEEVVVDEPAAVVSNGGPDLLGHVTQVGEDPGDLQVLQVGARDGLHEVVQVGLVVLVVVDPHRLLVDPGLEGLVIVGQGRE